MNTLRVDPNHYLDLVDGVFSTPTGRADLSAAFLNFCVNNPARHMRVFFHGGLVDPPTAIQTAESLIAGYTAAGAYPFFFIWHSGLWQTFEEAFHKHGDKSYFLSAAHQKAINVVKKINNTSAGAPRRTRVQRRPRVLLHAPVSLEELVAEIAPFEAQWQEMSAVGAQLELTYADALREAAAVAKLRKSAGLPMASRRRRKRPPASGHVSTPIVTTDWRPQSLKMYLLTLMWTFWPAVSGPK